MDVQELKQIAQSIGCLPIVADAENTIEKKLKHPQIYAAIAGTRNSGKTRLINQLMNQQVQEPLREEQQKPLRISFEELQDEQEFDCRRIEHSRWAETDTVLYEMRDEDILADGKLSPKMLEMDMVFYLVSAYAPFTSADMELLKSVAEWPCQVLLMDLDLIEKEKQAETLAYAEKLNNNLHLPAIIAVRRTEQDIGRIMRNLLPTDSECTVCRKRRAEKIMECAERQVKCALEAKLVAAEAAAAEKGHIQTASAQRKQVLQEICNSKESMIQEAERRIMQRKSLVASQVIESGRNARFDRKWRDDSSEIVFGIVQNVLNDDVQAITQKARQQINDYLQDASLFGINELEQKAIGLETNALLNGTSSPIQKPAVGNSHFESSVPTDSKKLLITVGTVAAMVGVYLVPVIPTALGSAAVIVGGAMVLSKEKEEEICSGLRLLATSVTNHCAEELKHRISESYNLLYNSFTEVPAHQAMPLEDENDVKTLKSLLDKFK